MPTRRQALQSLGSALLVHLLRGRHGAASPSHRTSWNDLVNQTWQEVLASYVDHNGWIDYSGLQQNPEDLYHFLGAVAASSPEQNASRFPLAAQRIAYWINAYNAMVLAGVIHHLPLQSVTQIGLIPRISFYELDDWVAGGRRYSLHAIESSILLRHYHDARILFALADGTRTGPRLQRHAYRAGELSAQLDDAAVCFLTAPDNLAWNPDRRLLLLSPLLLWHARTLRAAVARTGKPHPTLVDYLRWYVPAEDLPPEHAAFTIEYFAPDWRLNGS